VFENSLVADYITEIQRVDQVGFEGLEGLEGLEHGRVYIALPPPR
jgi:hypothetical protein